MRSLLAHIARVLSSIRFTAGEWVRRAGRLVYVPGRFVGALFSGPSAPTLGPTPEEVEVQDMLRREIDEARREEEAHQTVGRWKARETAKSLTPGPTPDFEPDESLEFHGASPAP